MIFICISCSQQNHVEIQIPVKLKNVVDYEGYEKIYVGDFKIDSSLESFNPETELYQFFTEDFSQSINKKIETLTREEDSDTPPQNLIERLKNFPNSLFITGELKINIKTRSIVKNVKSSAGSKNKAFVKVHLWEMILKIIMIESNSGKITSQNTFEEKLRDADPDKVDYSFKLMFDNITDRFIRKTTRKITSQKRYLIIK